MFRERLEKTKDTLGFVGVAILATIGVGLCLFLMFALIAWVFLSIVDWIGMDAFNQGFEYFAYGLIGLFVGYILYKCLYFIYWLLIEPFREGKS